MTHEEATLRIGAAMARMEAEDRAAIFAVISAVSRSSQPLLLLPEPEQPDPRG